MSLADDINKLSFKDMGVWPVPFKVAAMALLFGLLLAGGYWFIWKDQLEGLDRSRQEEQKLRTEFLEKKKQALNLDLYREQVKEIEQAFGALVRQLPNKSEMDALLTDINQAGLVVGWNLICLSRAPKPCATSTPSCQLPCASPAAITIWLDSRVMWRSCLASLR